MTRGDYNITRTILFVSVIANFAMVITFWGTLRVSPSDVLTAVQDVQIDLTLHTRSVEQRIASIQKELDRRGKWIAEVDAQLSNGAADHWRKTDMQKWLVAARKLNPELQLPTLSD